MSSYDRHGYVNNQQQAGRNFSVGKERGYVNNQDLSSSTQYEVTDYDSLNNSERDKDKHIYRGLDLKPSDTVAHEGVVKPHAGDGNMDNGDPSYKARGHRTLIVVIVVLIVLLVAMAAAFGFLYFKRTDDAPESVAKISGGNGNSTTTIIKKTLPTQETPETTQDSSTPEATTTRSTTSTSTTLSTTESLTIEEKCQKHGGLIPHPQECQSYYDCQHSEPRVSECDYPQLLSKETMACEHFENVTCGERTEAKQGCDYQSNNCNGKGCIPCHVRYPSCAGMEDGFNTFENRLWSDYYVICYKERLVGELRCSGYQRFSPEYRGCVDSDRIPSDHGGTKPDCTGKDGFYPNEYGRCNMYTECAFGQYKRSRSCPGSQTFDEATRQCSESPTSLCICAKSGC